MVPCCGDCDGEWVVPGAGSGIGSTERWNGVTAGARCARSCAATWVGMAPPCTVHSVLPGMPVFHGKAAVRAMRCRSRPPRGTHLSRSKMACRPWGAMSSSSAPTCSTVQRAQHNIESVGRAAPASWRTQPNGAVPGFTSPSLNAASYHPPNHPTPRHPHTMHTSYPPPAGTARPPPRCRPRGSPAAAAGSPAPGSRSPPASGERGREVWGWVGTVVSQSISSRDRCAEGQYDTLALLTHSHKKNVEPAGAARCQPAAGRYHNARNANNAKAGKTFCG